MSFDHISLELLWEIEMRDRYFIFDNLLYAYLRCVAQGELLQVTRSPWRNHGIIYLYRHYLSSLFIFIFSPFAIVHAISSINRAAIIH